VFAALCALIPNTPFWFYRQKPWEEKGLKEMLPREGQNTKQVEEINYCQFICLFLIFETESPYAAQAGLKLKILLPLVPECCDYRCVPP
jgi:hypothetical protein